MIYNQGEHLGIIIPTSSSPGTQALRLGTVDLHNVEVVEYSDPEPVLFHDWGISDA